VELARGHAVSGPLRHRLTRQGSASALPAACRRRLADDARAIATANLRRFGTLKSILAALDNAGIPVILLKGAHLATEVYPDLSTRRMSDLDLLVKPTGIDRAVDACHALGFETRHPPIVKGYSLRIHGANKRTHSRANAPDTWVAVKLRHDSGNVVSRITCLAL